MSLDAGIGANSASSGSYEIENSAVFDSSAGLAGGTYDYLYYNPSSTSNRRTATLSCWVKRSSDSNTNCIFSAGANQQHLRYQPGLSWRNYNNSGVVNTAASYRDTAAWYHVMMVLDTGNSTAASRNIMYVNGEAIERTGSTDATQNDDYNFNYASSRMYIGCRAWYQATETIIQGFDGYIAELHWIDGAVKSPTDFGEFDANGIWIPIEYTGTYGTNGAYLKFDNASNLGADSSGNGNNWTPVGITAANHASDSPTNNFATWQTQVNHGGNGTSEEITFTEGATSPKRNSGNYHLYCTSTMAMSSGKWYMEYKVRATGDAVYMGASPITRVNFEQHHGYYLGQDGGGSIGYGAGGHLYYWTGSNQQYTENRATGDIIGVALDKDNDKISFSKNGTFMQGTNGVRSDPTTPSTCHEVQPPIYVWAFGMFTGSIEYQTNMGGYTTMSISSAASDANGYGAFEYAPPTGFYALCTKNLAEYG